MLTGKSIRELYLSFHTRITNKQVQVPIRTQALKYTGADLELDFGGSLIKILLFGRGHGSVVPLGSAPASYPMHLRSFYSPSGPSNVISD